MTARVRSLTVIPALAVLAASVIAACVGDDPPATVIDGTPDGASDTSPTNDSSSNGDGGDGGDGGSTDADAKKPCSPTAPFTVIAQVSELNLAGNNDAGDPIVTVQARLSPDGRTVYFASNRDRNSRLY